MAFPLALEQLIEAGGNVRHEAHNKWTPLHCAAAAGDAHSCAILVDAGADADAEVRTLLLRENMVIRTKSGKKT